MKNILAWHFAALLIAVFAFSCEQDDPEPDVITLEYPVSFMLDDFTIDSITYHIVRNNGEFPVYPTAAFEAFMQEIAEFDSQDLHDYLFIQGITLLSDSTCQVIAFNEITETSNTVDMRCQITETAIHATNSVTPLPISFEVVGDFESLKFCQMSFAHTSTYNQDEELEYVYNFGGYCTYLDSATPAAYYRNNSGNDLYPLDTIGIVHIGHKFSRQ